VIESAIITLARHRLKWLKYIVADRHADATKIQNAFYELTGLTSIRFVDDHGLSDETRYELVLIDNLAILALQHRHPHIIAHLSIEAQRLARYLDMPPRELVDLIFKTGARFNDQEAISVAIHRGLIENLHSESKAYEKVTRIETRIKQREH
jgi:hypothetical protein